jgi:hypothetical protein
MSGSGLWSLAWGNQSAPVTAGVGAAANTAPVVAQAITVNGNTPVTGTVATLRVLGQDDGGATALVYRWSVTSAPLGGGAAFSGNNTNAAKYTTAAFTKAGTYTVAVTIVDAGGLSVTASKSFVVSPTLASVRVVTPGGQVVSRGGTLSVLSTSQALVAQGLDQFGNVLPTQPAFTWSTTSLPVNVSAPTFATSNGVTTIGFRAAGAYAFSVRAANATNIACSVAVSVNQTLKTVLVSPNRASVLQGATQQFAAQGLDQFGRAMVGQQVFTWTASAGTINASGLFTAPNSTSTCMVTARSGSAAGTAAVTVLAGPGPTGTSALLNLVQTLGADGSISRLDMIQVLRSAGADGLVDAAEFSDLKKVLSQAATLNIPGYVQVLAGNVINGNAANARFQGQTLGNLAAGSSAAQLNKLVDKWFLGADRPAICNASLTYQQAAGALFPRVPSHLDERQGMLGDCYFISALGTLADSNPAAVQNMFIDNGDGTFTVRFYTGTYGTIYNYSDGSISAGFTNNRGTADYVTVDRMLPASVSGILGYANYGANVANSSNPLWIALAEKAYAQWNETGKEGRDGQNAYASIQGGWMATVDAQVLGYNAIDYIMSRTSAQVAINALAAHKAVTIGTGSFSGTMYGLYATHAYAIVGYNASTQTFTLYNPWGSNQPGQLTWSQLQAATTQLCVCDTSGTVAIVGAPTRVAAASASLPAIKSSAADPQFFVPAGPSHRNLAARLVDAALASGGLFL